MELPIPTAIANARVFLNIAILPYSQTNEKICWRRFSNAAGIENIGLLGVPS